MEQNKTPFLTQEQISNLQYNQLVSIISSGESLNWDIKFEHESQEDLDDYINCLYNEKQLRDQQTYYNQ